MSATVSVDESVGVPDPEGAGRRARGRGWSTALAALAASLLLAIPPAQAAGLSFTGQLDPGNEQFDAALHTFTLAAPATVTIQSWGYGGSSGAPGGVNAAGDPIASGGFDPYVSLFAGSGPTATFVASSDDGSCPPGTLDAALCGDSTISIALAAGTYTIAVSAFLNMSIAENLGSGTLGDGFIGLGSFGGRTGAYAVDVSATTLVVPSRLLAYVPNGLTFGAQTTGVPSGPLAVTVTNVGGGSVALGALTVGGTNPGDFSASGTCSGTLFPGGSCVISVVFTPAATGARSASVSLASDASNAPIVFAVSGTGTASAVPVATLGVGALAFGTRVVGTSTTLPLTITNTGGAQLDIGSLVLAGPEVGDFTAVDGCSGVSLAPTFSCTVQVTFTPSATGARQASISIPSNAANSPAIVPMSGNGALLPNAVQPIPTLGHGLLALLALIVAAAGALARRRR